MEPNIKNQPPPSKPNEAATAPARAGQTVADQVSAAAQPRVEERGAEIRDQAKQKVGAAYAQANQRVSEQYEKALDYGRENPGITALLAFGLGVGVGLLLVGSLSTLRKREVS